MGTQYLVSIMADGRGINLLQVESSETQTLAMANKLDLCDIIVI